MADLRLTAEQPRHRLDSFMAWLPRLAVGIAFAGFIGWSKFSRDPHNEWIGVFERLGLGQGFRYFTGAMQVAGGILLLIPRTLTIGAAMLACTMIGAMAVHLFVFHTAVFAMLPAILLGAIVAVWWAGRMTA
ncbi:MAG: DoxX family protein [Acidobacteria bacterium]|nr:DoxX family protein [Acidobacteriota bacterium]